MSEPVFRLESSQLQELEHGKPDSQIFEIESRLLQGIFGCRSQEAVEASITYARFLSTVGITSENYPVFLKILEIDNRWVIDALIAKRDPFLLLSAVQPNRFIVERCLAMMTRWHKGGIYDKSLSVIMGVLQSVYSSPRDGYRIYPLTIADDNAIGKHLNKAKGQDDPLNRAILEVLEKIADLEDSGDGQMEEVAIHAAAIRNAFFDDNKQIESVIPPVLLVSVKDREEISPRRVGAVRAVRKTTATASPGRARRRTSKKKKGTRKR
jgi:hypothetical protein